MLEASAKELAERHAREKQLQKLIEEKEVFTQYSRLFNTCIRCSYSIMLYTLDSNLAVEMVSEILGVLQNFTQISDFKRNVSMSWILYH